MLRASPVPIIAIADGPISGPAAGLFLSASHRVATEDFLYSQQACHAGSSPGHGAISALAALRQPHAHLAMAVALGALELSCHDACELAVATHYAPSEALEDLASELACAPPAYFDVPLNRRARSAPPLHLTPLFAAERAAPLNAALHRSFSSSTVAAMRARLNGECAIAEQHAVALAREPCGIHIRTQERAQAVAAALFSASAALNQGCVSPEALCTTMTALQVARRQLASAPTAASASSSNTAGAANAAAAQAAQRAASSATTAWEAMRPSGGRATMVHTDLALDLVVDVRLSDAARSEGGARRLRALLSHLPDGSGRVLATECDALGDKIREGNRAASHREKEEAY